MDLERARRNRYEYLRAHLVICILSFVMVCGSIKYGLDLFLESKLLGPTITTTIKFLGTYFFGMYSWSVSKAVQKDIIQFATFCKTGEGQETLGIFNSSFTAKIRALLTPTIITIWLIYQQIDWTTDSTELEEVNQPSDDISRRTRTPPTDLDPVHPSTTATSTSTAR